MPALADAQKTIILMITDKCNLRCKHCFKDLRSASEAPLAAIEKLLDQVTRLFGPPYLALSGGEPTTHSRFGDILALIAARGLRCHVVTNAVEFEERVLPLALAQRAALNCFAFSLDGGTRAAHDMIRGPGSFDKVMRAAELCRQHGLGSRLVCTLHRGNLNQVDRIVEIGERQGVTHGVYFWPAFYTPDLWRAGMLLSPQERDALVARGPELARRGAYVVGDVTPFTREYVECEFHAGKHMTLDAEGNLSLCCNLTHNVHELSRRDVIGSILEEDLPELLRRRYQVVADYKAALLSDLFHERIDGLDTYNCFHCQKYFDKYQPEHVAGAARRLPQAV